MGSSSSSLTSNLNLSLRIVLISTGVLSAATAINFCFPTVQNFAFYDIWSVILSWLRPPYLYVVINGIIITIVASSRFHDNHRSRSMVNEASFIPSDDLPPSFDALEHPPVAYEAEVREIEVVDEFPTEDLVRPSFDPPVAYETENIREIEVSPVKDSDVITAEAEDTFIVCNPVREMPLVSSRFAHQRRMAKLNPEGVRSLRVAKPRKQETLESTWKAITDGRHMPLNRHLRKSDAFDLHHAPPSDAYSGQQEQTSETLPPAGGRLRKEASLSHDELNRRVEAFIKKFNDEMRLQRQESLKRYMEMINRGV